MGLFDRFTSSKGKDQTAGPKRGVVKATKPKKTANANEAFANVPAAKDESIKPVKKADKPAVVSGSKAQHAGHRVLLRAVVTEKSARGGAQSQYTFEVAPTASKSDVLESVRHLYGVAPIAVNIMNVRGKIVRFGRTYGRTNNRKKAIVTLPPGKTIDVVSA
jgi:large subunit ribosomal protein L23